MKKTTTTTTTVKRERSLIRCIENCTEALTYPFLKSCTCTVSSQTFVDGLGLTQRPALSTLIISLPLFTSGSHIILHVYAGVVGGRVGGASAVRINPNSASFEADEHVVGHWGEVDAYWHTSKAFQNILHKKGISISIHD